MKRKKTIKIEKAVRKEYVVTEKKEKRVRDYYITSPKGKALEIIRCFPKGILVMSKDEWCYCKRVRLTLEDGKVVAACEYEAFFNVLVERRIQGSN